MANFAYMSGTGNDFLVGKYDGPVSEIQIIALVSDAEYEIDGVIFVEPINNLQSKNALF
jgi:diaminopimelate epimerase